MVHILNRDIVIIHEEGNAVVHKIESNYICIWVFAQWVTSILTGANNSKENGIIKTPTMARTVPIL